MKWTKSQLHNMGVPASKREYELCLKLINETDVIETRRKSREHKEE